MAIPQRTSQKKATAIQLNEAPIGTLLNHSSDMVRSLALSVLVHSSSSIRPFSNTTIEVLRSNLGILFSDTDAKFRNDVLSNIKHMIERLRGAVAFLTREVSAGGALHGDDPSKQDTVEHDQRSGLQESLKIHEDFLEWLTPVILDELIPTASYQRHITSLKALHLLLSSGLTERNDATLPSRVNDNDTVWPFALFFFNDKSLRLILDLLMDPFEDVRIAASEVLKHAPASVWTTKSRPSLFQAQHQQKFKKIEANAGATHTNVEAGASPLNESVDILGDFLQAAFEASNKTGRADYADGVARTCDLIYYFSPTRLHQLKLIDGLLTDLDIQLRVAETDLNRAVQHAPLHGNFASLGYVPTLRE